jgi:ABC-type branched-subunit amino acid transport system ATPase component
LLLEATGIEKRYGGVRALRHVSFDLRAGEVHALIGENGAGKSTLIKVLTGAVQADAGTVALEGSVLTDNSPHRSRQLGIAAIYQQPAIFPDLTVMENIALVNEPGGLFRRVDWAARKARAKELIAAIGADIDPDREAGTLTMPEQQLVEIAKALGANVKVLILDEPTASLTERETDRLFEIVRRLRAGGAGIVYISHRLEELGRIADRITVLRDGETIETRDAPGDGFADFDPADGGAGVVGGVSEEGGADRRASADCEGGEFGFGSGAGCEFRGAGRGDSGVRGAGGRGADATGGDAVRVDSGGCGDDPCCGVGGGRSDAFGRDCGGDRVCAGRPAAQWRGGGTAGAGKCDFGDSGADFPRDAAAD